MLAGIAVHSRCAVSKDAAVHILVKGGQDLGSQHPVCSLKPLFPGTLQIITGVVDQLVKDTRLRLPTPVVLRLPTSPLPPVAFQHAGGIDTCAAMVRNKCIRTSE